MLWSGSKEWVRRDAGFVDGVDGLWAYVKNETILVVDDFCTWGRSSEAARLYLQVAGATARLYTWLKTINTSFEEARGDPRLKAYAVNERGEPGSTIAHAYHAAIVAPKAPTEIQEVFEKYIGWNWQETDRPGSANCYHRGRSNDARTYGRIFDGDPAISVGRRRLRNCAAHSCGFTSIFLTGELPVGTGPQFAPLKVTYREFTPRIRAERVTMLAWGLCGDHAALL